MSWKNTLVRSWAGGSRTSYSSLPPCLCARNPSAPIAVSQYARLNATSKRHQSSASSDNSSKRPSNGANKQDSHAAAPQPSRQAKTSASSPVVRGKPSRPRLLRLAGQDQQLGRVVAMAYAEELAVPSLIAALHQEGLVSTGQAKDALNIEGEALLLPDWFGGQCFLFENGGAAYWGVNDNGIQALEKMVLSKPGVKVLPLVAGARSESLAFGYQSIHSKTTGDMLFLQEPFQQPVEDLSDQQLTVALVPAPGESVKSGDIPALKQLERPEGLSMSKKALAERLAISAAMIRSTKISVYEAELEHHLEEIEEIPRALLEQQKVPGENTLIQHAGFLLSIRQRINLADFNLLDAPEFLWEVGSEIEESFVQACAAQDLEQRLQILNKKLDYAEAQNAKLLELENTRTSHRLEWIIIVLIALEIGLALLREGLPEWPIKNKKKEKLDEHHHAV